MAQYLLDTNLLLRFVDTQDARHKLAADATLEVRRRGHLPVITPQVLIELWAVVTRPVANNGFGWNVGRASAAVQFLISQFPLLADSDQVFPHWLQLVTSYGVNGKQVHDTRLVAVMLAHGITDLLTFNGPDFARFSTIRATDPAALVSQP